MNTQNKEKYNSILIITTQEGNDHYIENHMHSDSIKNFIADENNLLVFVYGGAKKNFFKKTDSKNIQHLFLKTPERYKNLAAKTYEAIRMIVNKYEFKFLHKGDDTKLVPNFYNLNKCNKDYGGCHLISKRGRAYARMARVHPDFAINPEELLVKGLRQGDKKAFRKWSINKNLRVDSYFFDDGVWYGAWKPYHMSYKFAKLIAQGGKAYSDMYIEYLGGCEDHMIGKIFKDLRLFSGLTCE